MHEPVYKSQAHACYTLAMMHLREQHTCVVLPLMSACLTGVSSRYDMLYCCLSCLLQDDDEEDSKPKQRKRRVKRQPVH